MEGWPKTNKNKRGCHGEVCAVVSTHMQEYCTTSLHLAAANQ